MKIGSGSSQDADQLNWISEREERSLVHGRVVDNAGRGAEQSCRNSSRAYRQKEGGNQIQKGEKPVLELFVAWFHLVFITDFALLYVY